MSEPFDTEIKCKPDCDDCTDEECQCICHFFESDDREVEMQRQIGRIE